MKAFVGNELVKTIDLPEIDMGDSAPLIFRVEILKVAQREEYRLRLYRAEMYRFQVFGSSGLQADEMIWVMDGNYEACHRTYPSDDEAVSELYQEILARLGRNIS